MLYNFSFNTASCTSCIPVGWCQNAFTCSDVW